MASSFQDDPSSQEGQFADRQSMVQSMLQTAQQHLQSDNLPAARDFLKMVGQLGGHDANSWHALGNVEFMLGNFEQAGRAFGKAARLRPTDAGLQVLLAVTCLRLRDTPSCQAYLSRAFALEPSSPDAFKVLADLHRESGEWNQAAQIYGKLIQANPDNVEILLSLALCFHKSGENEVAHDALVRVLQIDPDNRIARDNLAVLQRGAGVPETPAHGPSSTESPASEDALNAPAQQHFSEANRFFTQGDIPAARLCLERAAACAPRAFDVLICLGNVQFQLEDFSAALATFRTASTIRPNDAGVQVRLAFAALRCELIDEFETALARALELEPANPDALRLLANLNLQGGRFTDAAKAYRAVLAQIPGDIPSLLSLGKCCFELAGYDEARRSFEKVLELDPANSIARENLDVVQRCLSQKTSGRALPRSTADAVRKLQLTAA
jgi:tetratricopeptide (TPR) repeat protein